MHHLTFCYATISFTVKGLNVTLIQTTIPVFKKKINDDMFIYLQQEVFQQLRGGFQCSAAVLWEETFKVKRKERRQEIRKKRGGRGQSVKRCGYLFIYYVSSCLCYSESFHGSGCTHTQPPRPILGSVGSPYDNRAAFLYTIGTTLKYSCSK